MRYTIKTNAGGYVATVRDKGEAERQIERCDKRKPDDGPHYFEVEGGAATTDCGSIAPVEQWLKFAEQWAYDAEQEGELGEAKGHRTWSEVFEEHLAKRSAQERHEAAVASVMFQDDSWLPDSESEQ